MIRALAVLLLAALFSAPASAASLQVVYNGDYAPFSYPENGVMKGILVDLMNELGRRTGVTVQHQGYPWERAQLLVRNGEADAFVTLVNPTRAGYAVATASPILRVSNYGITSKTNPHLAELRAIRTLEDAEAFEHVNFLGSGWAKAKLTKAHVTWLSSLSAVFQLLISNRADLFLESEPLLEYNAQKDQLSSQLELLPAVFDTVEFYVQLSKKSPFVTSLPAFDAALKAMVADGTVNRVLQKYGHQAVSRSRLSEHP